DALDSPTDLLNVGSQLSGNRQIPRSDAATPQSLDSQHNCIRNGCANRPIGSKEVRRLKADCLRKASEPRWGMPRPDDTEDLYVLGPSTTDLLPRPAAIEEGGGVEHYDDVGIDEPMPKNVLEWIARPNVVGIQKGV